ncbi:hypothetical protein [Pseudonocardia nigra]|uniref:hypothetical protein n=1 Tax=Pseudonocardia nigra TaxID=1921578 RepID=UPI001C5DDD87|nr:hypothetical protein [Pseudonocardia nigra]
MNQNEWARGVAAMIAGEMKRRRGRMSAQRLADRCEELGYAIPRSVLANLESGRRETISVPEWLVLSAALRVPPLLLLFPLGRVETVEPLPDVEVSPLSALDWCETGHIGRGVEPPSAEDAALLANYREYSALFVQWQEARLDARRVTELLDESDEALRQRGEDRRDLEHELRRCSQREDEAVLGLQRMHEVFRQTNVPIPPYQYLSLPTALRRQLGEEDPQP